MAATDVSGPITVSATIASTYAGDGWTISGAEFFEVWIDDASLAYDVRLTVRSGDAIERAVTAGESFYQHVKRGTEISFHIKSASGTPDMQLIVL